MNFTLPELPYAFDALEPNIDEQTMKIHHDKHHGGYVKKLNNALEGQDQFSKIRIENLLSKLSSLPEEIQTEVRNNGGGHFNHSLFWQVLTPESGGKPDRELALLIEKFFGGFEDFQDEFNKAAANRFGSGWVWLCYREKKLFVTSTPNQDSPVMDIAEDRGVPILGLDVWEHAYYLKYQNKRADYINNFWNIVDWVEVTQLYNKAPVVEEVMYQKSLV